jgi:hypothetical protein
MVCHAMRSGDGNGLAGSECEALPTACAATPTCDCVVQTYTAGSLGESGAAGIYYCTENEDGTIQLECNLP